MKTRHGTLTLVCCDAGSSCSACTPSAPLAGEPASAVQRPETSRVSVVVECCGSARGGRGECVARPAAKNRIRACRDSCARAAYSGCSRWWAQGSRRYRAADLTELHVRHTLWSRVRRVMRAESECVRPYVRPRSRLVCGSIHGGSTHGSSRRVARETVLCVLSISLCELYPSQSTLLPDARETLGAGVTHDPALSRISLNTLTGVPRRTCRPAF